MSKESMSFKIAALASTLLLSACAARAQNAPRTEVAGIPVNYDESRVGNYSLPDPLTLNNAAKVRDAKTWKQKRRPEIVRLFEENQFGGSPGRPDGMSFDVFDKGAPALEGKALRKQVTVYLSFTANSSAVDDPGVKQGEIWNREKKRVPAPKGSNFGKLNVTPFLAQGIGVATVYYGDIDPDFQGGIPYGVRSLYLKSGQTEPAPDEWGAIGAWAWGLSRAMDYLETDKGVDAKRVAIVGISRLGKTVLWAGAHDERFAMVIASCSGEGGAALSRRNYGETIKHLTEPTRFPYQFAANYGKYGDRVDQFPVDAHMLIALIAPRPLLLQTGDTDGWSDPKGEFLAAVAAAPVFQLLGKQALGAEQMPPAGQRIFHTLGYVMHAGGHGTIPSDWDMFLEFMRMHLLTEKK
jgi:hypothetical protein